MTGKPHKVRMDRISIALADLPAQDFDVVIVGSGYGGSIAASRLAGAGKRVCLLERGREILPPDYPTDLSGAQAELQVVTARKGRLQPDANGMMELRVGEDVNVILGNGLGGGSLVNAGVSIRPDMRVFDEGWPAAFKTSGTERRNVLSDYFDRVTTNLGATKLPAGIELPKLRALEQSARAMGQPVERADINVTFESGPNAFGFPQAACTMCGDCCSGCNYGAKNTLLMNYLPDAHRSGATIVTEAEVDTVVQAGTGWTVSVYDQTKAFDGQAPVEITAGMVILAAGALGSTEVLLRSSRAKGGPSVSKALGRNFSANGDTLGFGFGANLPGSSGDPKAPEALYSIGAGTHTPDPLPYAPGPYQPGPCITGVIRVDMDKGPVANGLVIEDGTAPGPFATVYPPALFLQDVLAADYFELPDTQTRLNALADLGDALQAGGDPADLCYTGVMTRMQSYLVMSHDSASGVLELAEGAGDVPPLVHVSWAGAGDDPAYANDHAKLSEASAAIWASYIGNPIWQEGFGRKVISVHPLGGCPMADNEADGVTDAACRVYKGDGTGAVHDTLMVCDGSVIPTSLGVNPLLTISALTERAMDRLVGAPKAAAKSVPGALPAAPEPAAAAGPDWASLATDIGYAAAAVRAIEAACSTLGALPAGMAISALVTQIFPGADTAAWNAFIADFLAGADLPGDIGPAFSAFADDLDALGAAISGSPAGPFQPFLDTFFDRFGDVSPSFSFDETMVGHLSDARASDAVGISDPYEIAEALGRTRGVKMQAAFSILAQQTAGRDATGQVIANVAGAGLGGQVTLTARDGTATVYEVRNGRFDLLQPDPDRVETWLMTYRGDLWLPGASGPAWSMTGTKVLRRRAGSFWWTDLTTLFVDLAPAGTTAQAALQGIVRLDLQDLAAQAATLGTGFDGADSVDALKAAAVKAAQAHDVAAQVTKGDLLTRAFRTLLAQSATTGADTWPAELARGLEKYFAAGIAQLFGMRILRTYGGFAAYMKDFPSETDATLKALPEPGIDKVAGVSCTATLLPDATAPDVCLFHFPPRDPATARGPILIAPGMSTTALSFALLTTETSLVKMLIEENYDVWLFDSRLNPSTTKPTPDDPKRNDFTLDDVAAHDWPMAVSHVLANTPVKGAGSLQIVSHCVGALTAQMALLGGHVPTASVRQLVVMQFTVHPAPSWFNVVKSETGLAADFAGGFPKPLVELIHAELGDGADGTAVKEVLTRGIPKIDPVSPNPALAAYQKPLDQIHNAVDWSAPFGIDHMCYSPTCHRIYGLYGPVIAHQNVNAATHDAMRQIFGEIATKPFEQLGLIMERGRAVSASGEDIYLPNYERLKLPIHIISGSINQIVLPESGYTTLHWLKRMMPDDAALFTRTLVDGYAHNDCIIGKAAGRDVLAGIMDVLRPHAAPTGA